jgi:hypothetical protein
MMALHFPFNFTAMFNNQRLYQTHSESKMAILNWTQFAQHIIIQFRKVILSKILNILKHHLIVFFLSKI